MTVSFCPHDLAPWYTSPAGEDCCQWCEDVDAARTEARAEAFKEAAEAARAIGCKSGPLIERALAAAEIAQAIEAKLK